MFCSRLTAEKSKAESTRGEQGRAEQAGRLHEATRLRLMLRLDQTREGSGSGKLN